MGKHIPGNPTVVVQNMPGAGSLKAANFLYNVAPKDGTAIGMFGRGMAMEPLIGTSTAAQYDATKFLWLGSGTNEAAVFVIWHTKQIATGPICWPSRSPSAAKARAPIPTSTP